MKKIWSLLLAGVLACSVLTFTGCAKREEQLKLLVPGEYLDGELLDEFEDWYKEKTGKTVKVVEPDTFDVVEDILTKVEKDKADYDLLCPSDYAVERLIARGLLQEIDTDILDVTKVIKPEYLELARISDPDLKYSVPYMYGTFGIMYDYSKTGEHIDSWDAIFTDRYTGKSANKDSLREAFTSAAIYNNREELGRLSENFTDYNAAYHEKLQSIYEDTSEAAIDAAADTLIEMRNYSRTWGGESLKFDMAGGNTSIEVALMWSCDAGYVMNDYEDDDGIEQPGNRNMWYIVPKEGGNIYIDNFVISKYAVNTEAANYFLQFLCLKETALRNSAYAGAISPVTAAYDALYEEYTSDESYAQESAAWRDMYIDMLFPCEKTIARCGTMRDYGSDDGRISLKWSNVRNR